jgi:hypothetical protein
MGAVVPSASNQIAGHGTGAGACDSGGPHLPVRVDGVVEGQSPHTPTPNPPPAPTAVQIARLLPSACTAGIDPTIKSRIISQRDMTRSS